MLSVPKRDGVTVVALQTKNLKVPSCLTGPELAIFVVQVENDVGLYTTRNETFVSVSEIATQLNVDTYRRLRCAITIDTGSIFEVAKCEVFDRTRDAGEVDQERVVLIGCAAVDTQIDCRATFNRTAPFIDTSFLRNERNVGVTNNTQEGFDCFNRTDLTICNGVSVDGQTAVRLCISRTVVSTVAENTIDQDVGTPLTTGHICIKARGEILV